jgi:hypothetical protein
LKPTPQRLNLDAQDLHRAAAAGVIADAVSLTPLATYTIERMIGFWPVGDPGEYSNYCPFIHGSWVVMELATIAAAALALRYVKFGFLVVLMAFSFWFFSMDAAALLARVDDLNSRSCSRSSAWV